MVFVLQQYSRESISYLKLQICRTFFLFSSNLCILSLSSLRSSISFLSVAYTASLFFLILSPRVDLNNSEAHLIPTTMTFSLGVQNYKTKFIVSITSSNKFCHKKEATKNNFTPIKCLISSSFYYIFSS